MLKPRLGDKPGFFRICLERGDQPVPEETFG
jgi:hypothetical protein